VNLNRRKPSKKPPTAVEKGGTHSLHVAEILEEGGGPDLILSGAGKGTGGRGRGAQELYRIILKHFTANWVRVNPTNGTGLRTKAPET